MKISVSNDRAIIATIVVRRELLPVLAAVAKEEAGKEIFLTATATAVSFVWEIEI